MTARAAGPDWINRVQAFNALLRQLIDRIAEPQTSIAAASLFGVSAGTIGANLTERREAAAAALSVHPDHFRKHIEPRLLAQLAQALAADSERMTSTRVAPPQLLPMTRPPAPLPADMFAWEAVEHEEQLSRLWSSVYALRAELLACERWASMDPGSGEHVDAADAALWRVGQLHVAIRSYRRAYGSRLLHGDIPPERLIGMAGWTPDLRPPDVELLCHRGPDAERLRGFLDDLTAAPGGQDLRDRWVSDLLVPHLIIITGNRSTSS
ncbi:hypothetical protein F4553_000762 [Allocatelliglobosispora scoriae]|uniref:Uncharacterized protein n=1 Tax=Allocatelliglobosispora scoriae TaxID=643052 RepID=A0A841BK51_9ACTN|nr:hypothetical protein [Allocatelliglobosispora scoriae]MBB5867383.1 hypothetical protein [Allocatelliglobosispora scoriae]